MAIDLLGMLGDQPQAPKAAPSPMDVQNAQYMAQSLLAPPPQRPVYTYMSGLHDLANALAGTYKQRQASEMQKSGQQSAAEKLAGIYSPQNIASRGAALSSQDAPRSPQNGAPASYSNAADISTRLETGHSDPLKGISNISADTNGSRSYGNFGLNSLPGSSAWQFQSKYGQQLGLTARPGTAEFDQQWKTVSSSNPQALRAAEMDWYNNNVLSGVSSRLQQTGVDPTVASDPRVVAYFADRSVQQGPNSITNHSGRVNQAYALSKGDPVQFLRLMSDFDTASQSLHHDFPSALSSGVYSDAANKNRVHGRLSGALSIAPTANQQVAALARNTATDAQSGVQPQSPQAGVNQLISAIAGDGGIPAVSGISASPPTASPPQVINALAGQNIASVPPRPQPAPAMAGAAPAPMPPMPTTPQAAASPVATGIPSAASMQQPAAQMPTPSPPAPPVQAPQQMPQQMPPQTAQQTAQHPRGQVPIMMSAGAQISPDLLKSILADQNIPQDEKNKLLAQREIQSMPYNGGTIQYNPLTGEQNFIPGAPMHGVVGSGPFGPEYGWIYPPDREVTAMKSAEMESGVPYKPHAPTSSVPAIQAHAQQTGGTNEPFMDRLTVIQPVLAPRVKAISRGDEVLNPRDKNYTALMSMVYEYDPSFSKTDADSRAKYKEDFTKPGGKIGFVRQSINNAVGHAIDADANVGKLPKYNLGPLTYAANTAEKWWDKGSADPNMNAYNANVEALAGEIVKATTGSEGTQSARDSIKETLDPSLGQDAIRAALGKYAHILNSKLKATEYDWASNMGPHAKPKSDLVTPENVRGLNMIEQKYHKALGGNSGQAPAANAPSQQSYPALTQEQFLAAPSGTHFTAPDGTVRVKP